MRNILLHSLILAGTLSISLNSYAVDNATATELPTVPSQTQESVQSENKALKATQQSKTTMNQNTNATKKRVSGHHKHHAKHHGHKHHAKHHGHKHHAKHHGHKHHAKHGHCHYKHGHKHCYKKHAHGHKHHHHNKRPCRM